MRFVGFALAYFVVFLSIYVLSAASSFFVPLAISLVTSYFIITIAESIRRIKIYKRQIPTFIAFILSLLILSLGVYIIFTIVQKNVYDLIDRAPMYQERLNTLIAQAGSKFDLQALNFSKIIGMYDIRDVLRETLVVASQIIGNTGIIVVYILFILIEYGFYESKLKALFTDKEHLNKTKEITHKISSQIQSYVKIKTWISMITAGASYIVLKAVGVDFAEFWALMIFLLNYIPTIGSIIATIFPCLLAFVQFESIIPFIVVTSILVSIQLIMGNLVEPKIMGSQFNLSGLVILLSLIVWGKIWGIIGVFLCVPLLMILNIILANFPTTRPIAVMLSQNGKVE